MTNYDLFTGEVFTVDKVSEQSGCNNAPLLPQGLSEGAYPHRRLWTPSNYET